MSTLKALCSAETGGLETLEAVSLYPSAVTSPTPPVPLTYSFDHGWKESMLVTYTLSGTPWITAHAIVRFDTASPNTDLDFLNFEDGSGDCWTLRLAGSPSSGVIKVLNANSVVIATSAAAAISANKWYAIDVKFKHSDSTSLDIWIRECWKRPYRLFSLSSFDASSGGSTATYYTYNEIAAPYTPGFYCPHLMVFEDSQTGMYDDLTTGRMRFTRAYQDTAQGASGDWGNTLDSGYWYNAAELPANDSNYGVYDVTVVFSSKNGGVYCNGGTRIGPAGDSAVCLHDKVSGALYVVRCRSATNFPIANRVYFTMHHGSSTSKSTTAWPLAIPGVWNQASNKLHLLDGAHADCPTIAETLAIGAQADRSTADGSLWIGEMFGVCALERKRLVTVDGLIMGV